MHHGAGLCVVFMSPATTLQVASGLQGSSRVLAGTRHRQRSCEFPAFRFDIDYFGRQEVFSHHGEGMQVTATACSEPPPGLESHLLRDMVPVCLASGGGSVTECFLPSQDRVHCHTHPLFAVGSARALVPQALLASVTWGSRKDK